MFCSLFRPDHFASGSEPIQPSQVTNHKIKLRTIKTHAKILIKRLDVARNQKEAYKKLQKGKKAARPENKQEQKESKEPAKTPKVCLHQSQKIKCFCYYWKACSIRSQKKDKDLIKIQADENATSSKAKYPCWKIKIWEEARTVRQTGKPLYTSPSFAIIFYDRAEKLFPIVRTNNERDESIVYAKIVKCVVFHAVR